MRLFAMLVLFCSLLSTATVAEEPKKESAPAPAPTVILYTASQCGPVNDISHMLKDKYGEIPFAIGNGLVTLAQNGAIVKATLVFTVNPETKTFTVNGVMPDGNTCLLMSGNSFAPAASLSKKTKINLNYATRYNFPKLGALN
jgi:hypothetical protein